MNEELYSQIYSSFNHKSTDELVDIWTTNDRVEWSETAFEVMNDILEQRLGEAPAQNEPIFEHVKPEKKKYYFEDYPVEIIADIPEAPLFYKPKDILWITYWLERVAKAAIPIIILISLPNINTSHEIVRSFFYSNPLPILVSWLIALVIGSFDIALSCFIYIFSLKALASILRILMEMEFKSREEPRQTGEVVSD